MTSLREQYILICHWGHTVPVHQGIRQHTRHFEIAEILVRIVNPIVVWRHKIRHRHLPAFESDFVPNQSEMTHLRDAVNLELVGPYCPERCQPPSSDIVPIAWQSILLLHSLRQKIQDVVWNPSWHWDHVDDLPDWPRCFHNDPKQTPRLRAIPHLLLVQQYVVVPRQLIYIASHLDKSSWSDHHYIVYYLEMLYNRHQTLYQFHPHLVFRPFDLTWIPHTPIWHWKNPIVPIGSSWQCQPKSIHTMLLGRLTTVHSTIPTKQWVIWHRFRDGHQRQASVILALLPFVVMYFSSLGRRPRSENSYLEIVNSIPKIEPVLAWRHSLHPKPTPNPMRGMANKIDPWIVPCRCPALDGCCCCYYFYVDTMDLWLSHWSDLMEDVPIDVIRGP